MKKSLVIILIILILGGLGYFAYSKGLINLGFLKKKESVTEPIAVESQKENLEKIEDRIHPLCFKTVFEKNSKISVEECKKLFEKYKVAKDKDGFYSYSDLEPEDSAGDDFASNISYKILGVVDNKIFAETEESMHMANYYYTSVVELEELDGSYNIKQIASGDNYCNGNILGVDPVKDNSIEYYQIIDQEKVFGNEYYGTKFNCLGVGYYKYNILTDKSELLSLELMKKEENSMVPDFEYGESVEKDCFNDTFKSYIDKKKFELNPSELNVFNKQVKECTNKKNAPQSNTTTTYMCDGRVKIVREQDSPSLPPRISYLRVSDNAGIASYGDFGAYIQPQYFSIDRSKIEEGYSFNETNFCKYLKK